MSFTLKYLGQEKTFAKNVKLLDLIGDDKVLVRVTYIDGSSKQKEFVLPR